MDHIALTFQRGGAWAFAVGIALALFLAFFAYRRTLPPIAPGLSRLLAGLRFGAFVLLLLVLFDPLISYESVLTIRPHVAVLVDRSASMGIGDADESGVTRAAAADAILNDGGGMVAKLRDRYDVTLYQFADQFGPYDAAGELGSATDLSTALEGTLNAEWERGIDAVVLLSDGVVNEGRDPVSVARTLAIPIHAFPIGDPDPPRDLSVQQVLANQVVYVNSQVTVDVSVRARGFEGREFPVRIVEGDRVVAEKVVTVTQPLETTVHKLKFPVDREGIHRYAVVIPEEASEQLTENNRYPFTMEALKERVKVLVLADRPGWDLTFFRRVLEQDPNLEIETFIESRDGKVRPVADSEGAPSFPATKEDLFAYEVVTIFGTPGELGRSFGEWIDPYVRQRGGALLFFAVEPLDGIVPNRFSELLPVSMNKGRSRYNEEPFTAKLTPQGERHPVLRIHENTSQNRTLWSDLPPLDGLNLIGPVKPGATLLASHPTLRVNGAEVPLMALGSVGKGQVFLANGTSFWNWDFRMWGIGKTNRTYEKFWTNLVRWLVSRGGFQNVSVKPEAITYNRGEPVVFRGLALNQALDPVSDARIEVIVERDDAEVDRFTLASRPAEPGAYERTLTGYAPGDYTYKATVVSSDQLLGEDRGEFTVSDFSAEFLETARNDRLLETLVKTTGGTLWNEAEFASFTGDLGLAERTERDLHERSIWNHWTIFFAILGFFSFEWFLRKRNGLS